MNLLKALGKLFGAGSGASANDEKGVVSMFVRCARCGSIVHVRIRTSSDISRNDDDMPFVRKVVMDGRCYSRMELDLSFDGAYRIIEKSIRGGEFATKEQWNEQQRNLKEP